MLICFGEKTTSYQNGSKGERFIERERVQMCGEREVGGDRNLQDGERGRRGRRRGRGEIRRRRRREGGGGGDGCSKGSAAAGNS